VKIEWIGWKEEGMGRREGWGGGRDGEEEGMGRRKGWGGGMDREETPRREMCRRDSGRRDRGDGKKRLRGREGGIVTTGRRDS